MAVKKTERQKATNRRRSQAPARKKAEGEACRGDKDRRGGAGWCAYATLPPKGAIEQKGDGARRRRRHPTTGVFARKRGGILFRDWSDPSFSGLLAFLRGKSFPLFSPQRVALSPFFSFFSCRGICVPRSATPRHSKKNGKGGSCVAVASLSTLQSDRLKIAQKSRRSLFRTLLFFFSRPPEGPRVGGACGAGRWIFCAGTGCAAPRAAERIGGRGGYGHGRGNAQAP